MDYARCIVGGLLLGGCIENNLSTPVKVETVPSTPSTSSTTPAPPVEDPPEGDAPPEPCAAPEVLTVDLDFAAREDCPWGLDGNLEPLNERNRARVEELRDIVLPDGAQLCDLSIASSTADLLFDDHVTITLDDVVLVGGGYGYDVADLPVVGNLPRFAWTSLIDLPFRDRDAPYWCLGQPESVCVLPETELGGPLEVDLSDAATDDLMVAMAGRSTLPFRLVTFGDDDADDCAHTELTLQVEVAYELP
jgi:hypothetical protein